MSTSLISPTGSSSQTGSPSSSPTTLGGVAPSESTFLTLLVSQLKNQNPLNPTDSTQFVSELAQFSSLEQLIGINQGVGSLKGVVDPAATGTGASSQATSQSTSQTTAQTTQQILNSIG